MTGLGLGSGAPEGPGQRFRPDLEGLRAVAVLLVLLYHATVPGFGGGFVGVDVFFVLSGFLITGLIVREVDETGTVSLAAFYARRARRLLPAAAVVVAVTMLASAILLPPLLRVGVALDAAASALYAANIRFALQATDYLAAEQAPSPLLHYWSLGVEEQFYLVWPALLLLAARFLHGTARLWIVVAAVAVGSFALSLVLTTLAAPWAFFSLPTRAWELALGGLVAFAAHRGVALATGPAAAAAGVGLALVVAAGVLLDTATPFPGTAALVPTVGAALVIAAGVGRRIPLPSQLLAVAPMRWIGRISYSLYLWHWPILVIPASALGVALPLPVKIALVVLTFPIAAASQRWVEEPIRRGRLIGTRPVRSLALAGALTFLVAGTALGTGWIARETAPTGPTAAPANVDRDIEEVLGTPAPLPTGPPGVPEPSRPPTAAAPVPPDLQPPLVSAREDLPGVYEDGCHVEQPVTTSPACEYGDRSSPTTVVLFGDSHAAQWFPAVEAAAEERGWRLLSFTKALCAAVDGPVWNGRYKREYTECTAWRDDALERIEAAEPDLIVVANSKFALLSVDGQPDPDGQGSAWDAALESMLGRLHGLSDRVVLIGDTPQHATDPPVCLSAHLDDARACATPFDDAVPAERLAADAAVSARVGVGFLDPSAWLCPSEPCPVVVGRVLVYHDAGHMTATFSRALAPYLLAALPPLAR
jgi:peptidoglycan/LPS O-acetylase OafA/YrhL